MTVGTACGISAALVGAFFCGDAVANKHAGWAVIFALYAAFSLLFAWRVA